MDQPNRTFHFEFLFDGARERVFEAWTQPHFVEQWWGPHGSTNPVRKWDAKVGGQIHIDMLADDGAVYPMLGGFEEFDAPQRITFISTSFPDEAGEPRFVTRNTITFEDETSQTRVTVDAVVVKAFSGVLQALDGIELGWTESLERLGQVVSASR